MVTEGRFDVWYAVSIPFGRETVMESTKKKRRRARVDESACVACGCCLKVCPVGAITIYHGIRAEISGKCVGCGKCAKECPASVIELREVEA